MNDNGSSEIPLGLFELDATGTVVYYSPLAGEKKNDSINNVVGRNFFDNLIPGAQVEDLKIRFLNFMSYNNSVERLTINFPLGQSSIKVQIMMARLTERSENGRERLAVIRLLPEAHTPNGSPVDA